MTGEEKINIDEFDSKKFKNRFVEEEDNRKAVLTHYLHNYRNGIKDHFEKEATEYLKQIVEYKNEEENINILSDSALQQLLFEVEDVPFPTPENYTFKFIDLFAGIGGFRIALQNVGGKCVYTSEWNVDSQKTYRSNFGEVPFGDITKETTKNYIPDDFQVLCAGFPCQAFSIAGYRKGFHDTRGTLFFDLEKIIETKRPKVVFLENVKNLVSHDKGNTFKVILEILEEKLGYKAYTKVLNSSTHANVPQNRERIFIVAFDKKQVPNHGDFKFPEPVPLTKTIHDILEKGKQADNLYYKKEHQYYSELEKTITSKDTIYQWRRVYVRENKNQVCPTLTANMGTGGHNVPLILDDYGIRKLTPKECFAFQGYPVDKYILPSIANSKLYMQAGNSVTTPLIERISQEILNVLSP
ncbi:DNA cytosine methyltransferase [Flavobacterium quisquiliarum]|uniref:DNA (cytosine-5-)-methyltransferase n=1 Tax=Flavobacterium quisquiliarum TaxID=1834436 RepID=A0ABV8W5E0_9FLAO|nr:DNA cytosine methyltransferase [Flavobacterium quisquiliarum]MBW1657314.1 DNA (cytosine-5-)-methyltransferase [Flavobacterium quisquiliarum]NWL01984.1 DNA (cytosine-5-)-methyltransferase [Flavobacterium collinsii]